MQNYFLVKIPSFNVCFSVEWESSSLFLLCDFPFVDGNPLLVFHRKWLKEKNLLESKFKFNWRVSQLTGINCRLLGPEVNEFRIKKLCSKLRQKMPKDHHHHHFHVRLSKLLILFFSLFLFLFFWPTSLTQLSSSKLFLQRYKFYWFPHQNDFHGKFRLFCFF